MDPFASIAQIIMKQNVKELLNQTQTVQKHNLYFLRSTIVYTGHCKTK